MSRFARWAVAASVLLAADTLAAPRPDTCCGLLEAKLSDLVIYPTSSAYNESLRGYFSAQEMGLHPNCIVRPQCTGDVATAVAVLTRQKNGHGKLCQFAVKGGGHTLTKGAANIDGDGVTIDLAGMRNVTIAADKKSASVDSGAIWDNLYTALAREGLSTPGGRVASVGVAGLTTGGGISFLSPRYGFVCDNVINFEVVVAGGRVVNANRKENPDLYTALQGGSNNFGIVTRFDFRAYQQAQAWGGSIQYSSSFNEQVTRSIAAFNNATNYDEYASMIQNYIYVSQNAFPGLTDSLNVTDNELVYTKPVPQNTTPPVYTPWVNTISPKSVNTLRNTNLADITREVGNSSFGGLRQLYRTVTVENDVDLLLDAYRHWNGSIDSTIASASGLINVLTYHPLPPAITDKTDPMYGDVLGLRGTKKALVVIQIGLTWKSQNDDTLLTNFADDLMATINKMAVDRHLSNPFIYLNYAGPLQDPIAGYGPQSIASLKKTSSRVDPTKVFQDQVPGGFKLFK